MNGIKRVLGRSAWGVLLGLALANSSASAGTDPFSIGATVGQEYPVSDPVFTVTEKYLGDTAIGWSGQTGLVVWIDRSLGHPAILGTRVDADGNVLDPGSLLIHDFLQYSESGTTERVSPPSRGENLVNPGRTTLSMAWNGENYVLVWIESRTGAFEINEVYGTLITPDGVVLDPAGFQIFSDGRFNLAPRVACGSTNCLVSWMGGFFGPPNKIRNILGVRIDSSGSPLDASPIPIVVDHGFNTSPSVAWSVDQYLVAWTDGRGGIYGTRLTPEGDVLDGDGVRLSATNTGRDPGIGSASVGGFLVAYADGSALVASRIGTDGSRQDADGIVVSSGNVIETNPVVAWDGSAYEILWTSFTYPVNLFAARVDLQGNLLQEPLTIASSLDRYEHLAAIAPRGSGVAISWQDERSARPDKAHVFTARIDDGVVLDNPPPVVSLAANRQHNPSAAWDGNNHFVVWEDSRNSVADIYGARVAPDGTSPDGSGILVANANLDQNSPLIAWTGRNYVVAWDDLRGQGPYPQAYATRVNAAGEVLNPEGIPISQGDGVVVGVAGGSDEALVVWLNEDGIFCAPISGDGVLGRATAIVLERPIGDVAVAGNGGNYFVTWHSLARSAIYGTRVLHGGKVPSHAEVRVSPAGQVHDPSVSANGTGFLVAWTLSDPPSSFNTKVQAARVSRSGKIVDVVPIVLAQTNSVILDSTTVGWDGFDSMVVWRRTDRGEVEFYGRKVSIGGIPDPSDEGGVQIAALAFGNSPYVTSRLQSDSTGRLSFIYHRASFAPPAREDRVFLRFLDECADPQGACDIEAVAPAPSVVFASTSAPPTFWWGPGSARRFRVEFSATADFAHVFVSQKPLKLMTSYVPSTGKWKAIRRISSPGSPIYWRVAGVTSSNEAVTSDVRSFSVSP